MGRREGYIEGRRERWRKGGRDGGRSIILIIILSSIFFV